MGPRNCHLAKFSCVPILSCAHSNLQEEEVEGTRSNLDSDYGQVSELAEVRLSP